MFDHDVNNSATNQNTTNSFFEYELEASDAEQVQNNSEKINSELIDEITMNRLMMQQ